ncbi:hypothetical protein RCL1_008725 [Eukaryota sp. TZLM3-RCL]
MGFSNPRTDPRRQGDPLTFVVVFVMAFIGMVFLFTYKVAESGSFPVIPVSTLDLSFLKYKKTLNLQGTGGQIFSCTSTPSIAANPHHTSFGPFSVPFHGSERRVYSFNLLKDSTVTLDPADGSTLKYTILKGDDELEKYVDNEKYNHEYECSSCEFPLTFTASTSHISYHFVLHNTQSGSKSVKPKFNVQLIHNDLSDCKLLFDFEESSSVVIEKEDVDKLYLKGSLNNEPTSPNEVFREVTYTLDPKDYDFSFIGMFFFIGGVFLGFALDPVFKRIRVRRQNRLISHPGVVITSV